MEGKRSERELEIKHQQDTSESGDLPVAHDVGHPERLPDTPLTFEEQQRRFGGTEAAAHAQLAAEGQETPLPQDKLARQFGRDAESAADRQLERWDENHLEAAANELRKIKWLDPEQWKAANQFERERTLQTANRKLGEAYGWGALPLTFCKLPEDERGIVLGATTHDGSVTRINEKFLGSNDERFMQFDNPMQALGTVCHEYRHYYQEEQALTSNSSVRPDLPLEIAARWEQDRIHYVSWQDDPEAYKHGPLENDSNNLARRLCQRMYGESACFR